MITKTGMEYILVDTRNRYFLPVSTGNFKDGKGEFFSLLGSPGYELKGRITFSNIATNSVDWDFAILMGNDWKNYVGDENDPYTYAFQVVILASILN